jgi:hypothetical protein
LRPEQSWNSFIAAANLFLEETQEHALQGMNPGGYYHAIWCRDASYILRDWFICGNIDGALQQLYAIWSHQIGLSSTSKNNHRHRDDERIVYGRGSPEMGFRPIKASSGVIKSFTGALPTTIYQAGYLEVYGKNPDIDSTTLMVSTTSWILSHLIQQRLGNKSQRGERGNRRRRHPNNNSQVGFRNGTASFPYHLKSRAQFHLDDFTTLLNFITPRLLAAASYIEKRDIDHDGLVEQGHNEDWMDTALRAGKIVYSQASWILALKNLSMFLETLSEQRAYASARERASLRKQSKRLTELADATIRAVEKVLWSDDDGCYIDIQVAHHIGGPYRTLTQDVSLYLVAITENTGNDNLRASLRSRKYRFSQRIHVTQKTLHERGHSTLDRLSKRIWKYGWPMNVEALLMATGPWVLKPHQYHNQTFWPWTTGIEMLARSRFDRVRECEKMLSLLASQGQPHVRAFYEWLNPITKSGDGAYPFRTGMSGIRIALRHILSNINSNARQRDERKMHSTTRAARVA